MVFGESWDAEGVDEHLEGQVGARFELRPGPDEDGTVVVFMALTAPFFDAAACFAEAVTVVVGRV